MEGGIMRNIGHRALFGAVTLLALVAAACGDDAGAGSGSDSLSLEISSPEEGAEVSSPFTLTVEASVPLDDPSTGEHHVHLCFDEADCDAEYQLVYGETFEVGDLSAGEHTVEASLRNADHSDAGVSDEITVTVGGAGAGDGGAGEDTGGGGYGY
jgi:hypothetical protein